MIDLRLGDCREGLRAVEAASVHCCVTSPPYFGLRDYGVDGQIGLEQTPAEYVEQMVAVFREVRRVLRDDGTLWLNLGDSYAGSRQGPQGEASTLAGNGHQGGGPKRQAVPRPMTASARRDDHQIPRSDIAIEGLKPKDLVGIPWRVAFALQADGWWLRQDIIWHKPNPMPESVRDRCTKAHEYVFLLSKSERYYFDSEAMQEPATGRDPGNKAHKHADRVAAEVADGNHRERTKLGLATMEAREMRNKRSVWTVATRPYSGAHFAVFPPALIEPCIRAGAPRDGLVLDPFTGSGTTAAVALQHGRRFLGFELNPAYIALAQERVAPLLPAEVECPLV